MTAPDELYIDRCPTCDHPNATVPLSIDRHEVSVECAYRCSEGHAWRCS